MNDKSIFSTSRRSFPPSTSSLHFGWDQTRFNFCAQLGFSLFKQPVGNRTNCFCLRLCVWAISPTRWGFSTQASISSFTGQILFSSISIIWFPCCHHNYSPVLSVTRFAANFSFWPNAKKHHLSLEGLPETRWLHWTIICSSLESHRCCWSSMIIFRNKPAWKELWPMLVRRKQRCWKLFEENQPGIFVGNIWISVSTKMSKYMYVTFSAAGFLYFPQNNARLNWIRK